MQAEYGNRPLRAVIAIKQSIPYTLSLPGCFGQRDGAEAGD
jgi:hypothetical protein